MINLPQISISDITKHNDSWETTSTCLLRGLNYKRVCIQLKNKNEEHTWGLQLTAVLLAPQLPQLLPATKLFLREYYAIMLPIHGRDSHVVYGSGLENQHSF